MPAAKGKILGSATAASILGTIASPARNGQAKIKPEWAKYYKILLDLREQLIRQMNGLAKESAQELPGYSLHMADSGTDNFDRDFALSLLSSDQDAVYEIDEALKRIERNTYGICELTGKPIPKARLDAIPWARFTVEAQAQLSSQALSNESISQVELGRQLFVAKGCITCHVNNKISNSSEYWTIDMGATNLSTFSANPEVLFMRLKDPTSVKSDTKMPNLELRKEEIEALVAFINSQ